MRIALFMMLALLAIMPIAAVQAQAPVQNDSVTYVPMPPIPNPPLYILFKVEGASTYGGLLNSIASNERKFWDNTARHRINVITRVSTPITGGIIGKQHKLLELIPGANSHVPIIGNGISAHHEAGHEFGVNHSSTRIWSTQTTISYYRNESDPYDPMTTLPGTPTLNAPHIHHLQWFTGTEEAYAEDGGEYNLTIFYNPKNIEFTSLKSLYYEVPTTTRQYWFTYQGFNAKSGAPILAIHSSDDGGFYTYYEGNVVPGTTNIRTGLIFELSNVTATTCTVDVTLDPTWVLEE